MAKGIIYCMKTIVPGLIVIGKTTVDLYESRMNDLERNGCANAVGLKRRFAIEVEDCETKMSLLNSIFSESRVSDTELFALDMSLIVQLLSAFAGKQVFPLPKAKDDLSQASYSWMTETNYDDSRDELFMEAAEYVVENEKASIGNLQRVFRIGFNRAARIMDQLAEAGIVSNDDGTKARQILMDETQLNEFKAQTQ